MKKSISIPIEKSNIKVGKQYYTCTYGSVIKVTIIKVFQDTDAVLVRFKDNKPFVRQIKYIFDNAHKANSAYRDWEHDERKRRKQKK